MTLREHLQSAEAQTGVEIPELHQERVPIEVAHIWEWFKDLHAARAASFGPSPISYADIEAWARLTGRAPTRWEVSCIKRLDVCFLTHCAKKSAASQPPQPSST